MTARRELVRLTSYLTEDEEARLLLGAKDAPSPMLELRAKEGWSRGCVTYETTPPPLEDRAAWEAVGIQMAISIRNYLRTEWCAAKLAAEPELVEEIKERMADEEAARFDNA